MKYIYRGMSDVPSERATEDQREDFAKQCGLLLAFHGAVRDEHDLLLAYRYTYSLSVHSFSLSLSLIFLCVIMAIILEHSLMHLPINSGYKCLRSG